MSRPEYIPIFQESENDIINRMLSRISDAWRKEPGDFIYDAVAATPLEVQLGEIQRDFILKNAFPQFADSVFMDYCLWRVGLTRDPATANKRRLQILADAGVVIPKGYGVLSVIADGDGNPYEFTVDAATTFTTSGSINIAITCKSTGANTNLPSGTQFILQPPIPGVRTITDLGTTTPAQDAEDDESAYARYEFKVRNPDTGGNKTDYIRWALSIDGVGKAKCVPRWSGVGTVKVVLIGDDYKPATPEVVAAVQNYLDPGYPDPLTMGQGEGKAPCGAAVTVVSATGLPINVAATVQYTSWATQESVKAAFETALDSYFNSIAFLELIDDPEKDNSPVIYAKIGSLLIGTEGVANYSGLKLNGGYEDISVATDQVAIRGAVTFD